jgi:hypothetical protein
VGLASEWERPVVEASGLNAASFHCMPMKKYPPVITMSAGIDTSEAANGIITLYEPSSDTCNVEYASFFWLKQHYY